MRFNLKTAASVLGWMRETQSAALFALCETLKVRVDEIFQEVITWQDVARHLCVAEPNGSPAAPTSGVFGPEGVIEQFRGFFALDPMPETDSASGVASSSLHQVLEWKEINKRRILKQADVLMLPFLFPEAFSRQSIRANYNYYEPITAHASSLSFAVHAAVAARVGLCAPALEYWRRSLFLDLTNSMGNSGLGIHAAAAGGAWQALVFHLLDLRLSESGPRVGDVSWAVFPEKQEKITMRIVYRGKVYPLTVTR